MCSPRLDPATLRGTVVGIPCMNTPAFEAAARASGIDHAQPQPHLPRRRGGLLLPAAGRHLRRAGRARVDAVVDLHTGGAYGEIAPLVILQGGYEDLATGPALAAGHELVWKGGKWGGTVRHPALAAGKPAITIEVGGGTYREAERRAARDTRPQHPAAASA